jgi:hypothetical protein
MKRRIVYFALFIAAALAGAQTVPNPLPTYWPWTGVTPAPVPITASAIADEFGNPYSNVSLCFTPVDGNGTTTGFRVGPVQVMAQRRCGLVSSGVLAAGLSLAPTPTGIYYHPQVIDRKTGNVLRDYCVTAITGSSWTLDTYDCALPNAPPPAAGSIGAAATGQLAIYVGASPTTTLAGIPFQGLLNTGSMLTTGITSSGAPTATCDAAHLFVKAYDLTNLGQEYTCLQKADSTYTWQLTAGGGSSSGGGGVTSINTSLPLSTYSLGGGMCHITDSTGPGDGSVTGSTSELLLAAYNGQGCNPNAQQYKGTWYCNQGASADCASPKGSGNATTGDIMSQQLYPNEDPPDTGAYDYYFQHGFGDRATCGGGTIGGWGAYPSANCGPIGAAALTAGYMWAGTTKSMKLRASAAAQSGTATFAPPTSFANGNFAPGTPMCATTGGTLTFTTLPASGVIGYTWIVSGSPLGADTANVYIDGTLIGPISSGAGGAWGTNWAVKMWWGQWFTIPNSNTGPHTLAITTTAGNFCSVVAVTPSSIYNGLTKPLVVDSGMYVGSPMPDQGWDAVYRTATAQAKANGLSVEYADLWQGWPESKGDSHWYEFSTGTYPGGMSCVGGFNPHYNNCGDVFNAWQFLRTSGKTPAPVQSVSGDGTTITCSPFGRGTKCAVTGTAIAKTTTPNTFLTGEQKIYTGSYTTPGLSVYGTASGIVAPALVSSTAQSCASTITVGAGHAVMVLSNGGLPTSSGGETWTTITTAGGPSGSWLANVYIGTNMAGGSETMTYGGASQCVYLEYATVAASNPLDGAVVVDPGPYDHATTLGPLVTTNPNDLLVTIDFHDNAGVPTGFTGLPGLSPYGSGYMSGSMVAATAGSYSASWGCGAFCGQNGAYVLFAIKGAPAGGQVAHIQRWFDANGVEQSWIDGAGKFGSNLSSSGPTNLCSVVTLTNATCSSGVITVTAQTTVTIANIPGSFVGLRLKGIANNSVGYNVSATLQLQFNADTGTSYGTTATIGNTNNSLQGIWGNPAQHYIIAAPLSSSTIDGGAATFNGEILGYASSAPSKNWDARFGAWYSGPFAYYQPGLSQGSWKSSAAITSMTLSVASGTFSGSFYLYGEN